MVLSALNIHGLNVLRMTLVCFWLGISWLWLAWNLEVAGSNPTQSALFSLLQRCIQAPEELTVSGFNFTRFLAVANFTNIKSNQWFCPVLQFLAETFCSDIRSRILVYHIPKC